LSDRRRRLFTDSGHRRARRIAVVLAAAFVVLGGMALAAYLYERHRTGSIYHPHARFIPQPTPTLPAKGPERFSWPLYGYDKQHTRFFPASPGVRPPFARVWVRNSHALLEFPPVIYGDHLFQLADDGVLAAIDKNTGRTFWERRLGVLSASTPAVDATTVFVSVLSTYTNGGPGRVVALDTRTGAIRWSRPLSSRTESSPLLDGNRIYVGSQGGTVYALRASNGSVVWTYHAGGSVKASPTLSGGLLYFGDYSGHVQAISEQTGRRVWLANSEGALLGSGTFYSTAAVVYGRVFLGNTDGRVYAYDAYTGKLDWAVQTGAYVYASPAVTNAPGLGPTVFVGSYDGTFYALNARTGSVSWRFHAGGPISGSATIIGRVVYLAALHVHQTYGLGISTGRLIFERDTGSFDPAITDDVNVYFTGSTGLYALVPH
jgi:outer membrane protein assembly factor BamB